MVNMFTENDKTQRGRPRGTTAQGLETRQRLYETAIALITERGYEETTLRDVADAAGVSVGLLYRYFPGKRAVVLALYEELSTEYARRAAAMNAGKWRDRFVFALETSLDVLRPHRQILVALVPALVGDPEEGLFAAGTAFSRVRVQQAFQDAMSGAKDAPAPNVAEALGRLLYLLHLSIILLWLLDRSLRQRATGAFVSLLEKSLTSLSLALRLRTVRAFVCSADAILSEALNLSEPAPSTE